MVSGFHHGAVNRSRGWKAYGVSKLDSYVSRLLQLYNCMSLKGKRVQTSGILLGKAASCTYKSAQVMWWAPPQSADSGRACSGESGPLFLARRYPWQALSCVFVVGSGNAGVSTLEFSDRSRTFFQMRLARGFSQSAFVKLRSPESHRKNIVVSMYVLEIGI